MDIMLKKESAASDAKLGQQLMAYARSLQEEGQKRESEEAYAAKVYAKARSGQRLTPEEMSFLARTNPELYRKVLRAQTLRRELESRLKNCKSKQEAQEVFSAAVGSISEKDPDRDMIIQALNQAFKEFKKSGTYENLPETREEAENGKNRKKGQGTMEYVQNGNGYQEVYLTEEEGIPFVAGA
ncbi:hypothetical protein D3Z45_13695 [Lachnospiraceae bacterium]|nr:hypothetical protein [Lachnospiraceae bacterium]